MEEVKRQELLRDREYLRHMRQQAILLCDEHDRKLEEYLRLKGEFD